MNVQATAEKVAVPIWRQAGRTWALFVLLAVGLWLISRPEPQNIILWNFAKLPAAFGAFGVGSWLLWQTLLKEISASDTRAGAILSAATLVASAILVGLVVG